MKYISKKNGFTIIELLIATTVFSFILLVTSAAIIAIGRAYYKSLTSSRVQETARSVMDDVSRSLQFSSNPPLTNENFENSLTRARCFGSDRYTYVLDQRVGGGAHGLYRDKKTESVCEPNTAFTGGQELLGESMRLLQFDVSGTDPFQVEIRVAYGDNDLLNHYNDDGTARTSNDFQGVNCKPITGRQFCAVAGLETSIKGRVGVE